LLIIPKATYQWYPRNGNACTIEGLMSVLHEAQLLLAKMTRAEKATLLQEVVQDLGDAFPGIEARDGVCGGEPCIRPYEDSGLDPASDAQDRYV
jgi:hypothetical protein